MIDGFSEIIASLRRTRGISQRQAAADMGISQALLSHYETGAREPGLSFVRRACDYYNVSADYMLCRTEYPEGGADAVKLRSLVQELSALSDRARQYLKQTGE